MALGNERKKNKNRQNNIARGENSSEIYGPTRGAFEK
jgi:hypothetical protein